VYLFLIIVFLYINSPENTRVGVNHSVLLRRSVFTESYVSFTLLMSGILVVICSFFVFSKKSSTGILKPLLLLLGFGVSVFLLQEEFFQVIFALSKSSSLEAKIAATNFDNKIPGEVLGLEKTMREDLVVNHFTVLLVFLKF